MTALALTLVGCAAPAPAPFTCSPPQLGPLPEWARAGFSPPDQDVQHVRGVAGTIVAVPFGWPLRAPQPEGRSNKILWVAEVSGGGPLKIRAGLADGTAVEREVAGGPGPSIIDLPRDGCWRFDLTWPGGHDTVELRYEPGA